MEKIEQLFEIFNDKLDNVNNYSELSKKITSELNTKIKKDLGIFFTPQNVIFKILESIQQYTSNINSILEPSCGSCEFISIIDKIYTDVNITGIELNNTIPNNINATATINHLKYL